MVTARSGHTCSACSADASIPSGYEAVTDDESASVIIGVDEVECRFPAAPVPVLRDPRGVTIDVVDGQSAAAGTGRFGSLRITAVIDWGLSTLGHPLADLAYGWLPYHLTVEDTVGFGGVDPAELGIPTEVELLEV